MRWALLVVVLAACRLHFDDRSGPPDDVLVDVQPPATFVPNWNSGTRIRAITYRAVDGGDPHWFNWRDTQLDTDCNSVVAADGAERCLPQTADAGSYYADAGCTTRLVAVRGDICGRHTKFGFEVTGSTIHVYPLAGIYSGAVYDLRVGCSLVGTSPGVTFYTAGAESDPTMFEPSIYHNEHIGDYDRQFQGFTDGASIELGSFAFNLGPCRPFGEALGPMRCRPDGVLAKAVYLDAGCTDRVYLAKDFDTFAVLDPGACNADYTLFKTTADVTGPSYWEQTPAGCIQNSTPGALKLLRGTATSIPFPVGTVVPGPNRGPLGTLYWIGPDGKALTLYYSWDQNLHRLCRPFIATDGKMRCTPIASTTDILYPDQTCTSAPRVLAKQCLADVIPVDGPTYSSCEDTAWDVATLGKVTDMAAVNVDGACTLLPTPAYDPSVRAGAISPSTFPELTFTVE